MGEREKIVVEWIDTDETPRRLAELRAVLDANEAENIATEENEFAYERVTLHDPQFAVGRRALPHVEADHVTLTQPVVDRSDAHRAPRDEAMYPGPSR